MKESSLRPALAAVALLLLPVVYFGTYSLLLVPVWGVSQDDQVEYTREPEYWLGGVVAKTFFYPANLVDRQVRPDFWDEVMVYDFEMTRSTYDLADQRGGVRDEG